MCRISEICFKVVLSPRCSFTWDTFLVWDRWTSHKSYEFSCTSVFFPMISSYKKIYQNLSLPHSSLTDIIFAQTSLSCTWQSHSHNSYKKSACICKGTQFACRPSSLNRFRMSFWAWIKLICPTGQYWAVEFLREIFLIVAIVCLWPTWLKKTILSDCQQMCDFFDNPIARSLPSEHFQSCSNLTRYRSK